MYLVLLLVVLEDSVIHFEGGKIGQLLSSSRPCHTPFAMHKISLQASTVKRFLALGLRSILFHEWVAILFYKKRQPEQL